MFCKNCGKELEEGALFCPGCGTRVQDDAQQPSSAAEGTEAPAAPRPAPQPAPQPEQEKPAKVWGVFALVGMIIGIVCLVASFIPYLNYFSLVFGIAGIVLSCLGRKAKTEEAIKRCNVGLGLSIAAVVISVVMIIVYTVVLFAAIAAL